MSNPPQDVIWVPISNNCRMLGKFEVGHRVPHITIFDGDCDVHLLLERGVLDRVIRLSQQMLAVPENRDSTASRIVLESTRGDDNHDVPRTALTQVTA